MADTKLSLLGVGVFDVNSLHLVKVIDGQDPDLNLKPTIMILYTVSPKKCLTLLGQSPTK